MASDSDDDDINILFEVTTAGAADIFVPLAKACNRAGLTWGCFFSGDGVECLSSEAVAEVIETAVTAIACGFSWKCSMGELTCPIFMGHQTNNSAMVGDADKVISL